MCIQKDKNTCCALFLSIVVILTLFACSQSDKRPYPPAEARKQGMITVEEAQNATYSGLQLSAAELTLTDGRWQGEPYQEGAAARPSVALIDTFMRSTDLDRDGRQEAIVFLSESAGGSGSNTYLAILHNAGGKIINSATRLLGDRIQIKKVDTGDGVIGLEIVQAGPDDPACCPGEIITQHWRLSGNQLTPAAIDQKPRRLSLTLLEGSEWTLINWGLREPAVLETEITLSYHDSTFGGSAGCNRYFISVREEQTPGTIKTGITGATRMMCSDAVMAAEDRFLKILEACDKYGFRMTHLMLAYTLDGKPDVLLFRQKEASQR